MLGPAGICEKTGSLGHRLGVALDPNRHRTTIEILGQNRINAVVALDRDVVQAAK